MSTGVRCSVAALGSVLTVAAGVKAITYQSNPPKYNKHGEQYDPDTFLGRYQKMVSLCDPTTLLYSNSALLERKSALEAGGLSDSEAWFNHALVSSAFNPDTGEIIPRPARMAGYLPFNGPVCVAMIMSTSTPALLFWNWTNQSMNAAVNYFNRSASSPTDDSVMVKSYLGAVSAALLVVFGMSTAIKRLCTPQKAATLLKFTAFPACLIASSSNCYIIRRPELSTGIQLTKQDGTPLASDKLSKKAAERAVWDTVYSRVLLQVPVYFIPAVMMASPPFSTIAAASPSMGLAWSTYIGMTSFGFGLPAALAAFKQQGCLNEEDVEEDFRGLGDNGKVYYNKGL